MRYERAYANHLQSEFMHPYDIIGQALCILSGESHHDAASQLVPEFFQYQKAALSLARSSSGWRLSKIALSVVSILSRYRSAPAFLHME